MDEDLLTRVDDFVETNTWGFNSRAEVIHTAIREFLEKRERLRLITSSSPDGSLSPEERQANIERGLDMIAEAFQRQEEAAKGKGRKKGG